jgi:excisionase family DNA binding protein
MSGDCAAWRDLLISEDRMNLFEKDVLTTGEVAKICNVASRTVSKWFDSGQLRGYRIPGSKDRRIPVSSLIRFMKSHGIPLDGLMSGNTRVLIVDPDEEVGTQLREVLSEQTSYEVRISNNFFQAGIECERFRPHVMLVDIHLSDGDAQMVTRVVRENDDLQVTKLIAMSGKLTDGQAAQLTHQGFNAALRKPFTVRQVIDAIEGAHAIHPRPRPVLLGQAVSFTICPCRTGQSTNGPRSCRTARTCRRLRLERATCPSPSSAS